MPGTLQTFLADATTKASNDLVEALKRLPEDKQNWSPGGSARTALDMVAEIALLNGQTADLMTSRIWPADYDFDEYGREKTALAADAEKTLAILGNTTPKAVAAILALPDDVLDTSVTMPWGPMKVLDIMSYPYWNMKYHTGQINYIASILGCLD